ncbi:MAG: DNA repair protein RecO [Flavobacteriales bacterium]
MYQSTKGIVLSTTKYGETSVICNLYTSEFGRQAVIVKGVRKKKGKFSYFQSLNILELVIFNKGEGKIHNVKEVKVSKVFSQIPVNIYKSSIAMFLAEVIEKCLKEEEQNISLYQFIEQSILKLDEEEFNSQFHIFFLVELSRYLGFYPNLENNHLNYFDLMNGQFSNNKQEHSYYCVNTKDLISAFELNKVQNKKEVLNHLLDYYQLHVEGFKTIKSKAILETILNA